MISTLITAALISQATPTEAICTLEVKTTGSVYRRRVSEIDVGCPDNVPDAVGLQTVADAAVTAVNIRRLRSGSMLTADQAWFQHDAQTGWSVIPGQIIISEAMALSPSQVQDGIITQSCAWSALPGEDGRALGARVTCYVDGRTRPDHVIREAEGYVEDMIRNTRFLPVDVQYCFQDEVRLVTTAINVTGGRFNNDNTHEPDMRPLPQLCG